MRIERRKHFEPHTDSGRPALASQREVMIPPLGLAATLTVPAVPRALIVCALGSGASRLSPRSARMADALNRQNMATLLLDLLPPGEQPGRSNLFDVRLLARRLADTVRWAAFESELDGLPTGLFGAGTGAAAALVAAAGLGSHIGALVSRGGRPDLAHSVLPQVRAATLLIVGGEDTGVVELNRWALDRLAGTKAMQLVPGATHLFPEPGALDTVTDLASAWFRHYLQPDGTVATAGQPGPPRLSAVR